MMKIKWEIEWKTDQENARCLRKMSKYPGTVRNLARTEIFIEIFPLPHLIRIERAISIY